MTQCTDGLNVVLGMGPVGVELACQLATSGCKVRIVSRKQRAHLRDEVEFLSADLTQREQAVSACAGASVVYSCVGIPYMKWVKQWPVLMDNMLVGATAAAARFVFADNLYMYGPQTEPLHEDMPLTDYGVKPAMRAQITRQWLTAHQRGDVNAVAVRASDFYGGGVTNAALGRAVFASALFNKTAQLLGPVDQPHSFTYVPDFARALITLAEAKDSDYGQAWHVPNAPTTTVGEVVEMIYAIGGQFANPKSASVRQPRWTSLTPGLNSFLGLFVPVLRELRELRYQWDAPYIVDHTKFGERFWFDATPFEVGIEEAMQIYSKSP